MKTTAPTVESGHAQGADKLGYIDAVRGWAILLVMTCHVGGAMSGVPYPLHKLTNFGWHGVQLFFLASAVTLMMSWQRSDAPPGIAVRNFFLRRFWRIAPMYYAGACIYLFATPPGPQFDIAQLLRALAFVNVWSPRWIPTTADWMVVPGGWSIGVEFAFYALFPIIASLVTNLRRALLLFFLSIPAAVVANAWAVHAFDTVPPTALTNFLYFWFPNQAPVFALGLVLYHLITSKRIHSIGRWVSAGLMATAVVIGLIVAEAPWKPQYFASLTGMPPILFATLAFMLFVFALAKGPPTLLTHPWMQRLGVLSFSCYVLHFLFVDELPIWSRGLIDISAIGFRAISMLGVFWLAVVGATVATAMITHRWIEMPGMRIAKLITARRVHTVANSPAG